MSNKKVFRFEDLPEDIRADFRDASLAWRVRVLRSYGWPDERIRAFLDVEVLPSRTQDPKTSG